jgi:cytochrome c oxidase cbb3-type subunit IV
MDINILRSAVTVTGFLIFVGILVWAWRPAQKDRFNEASQLPFQSD